MLQKGEREWDQNWEDFFLILWTISWERDEIIFDKETPLPSLFLDGLGFKSIWEGRDFVYSSVVFPLFCTEHICKLTKTQFKSNIDFDILRRSQLIWG